MPRMLDMIRSSQVPANLMQSAARGALSVPPGETIEILVYLALHHKLFGPQARITLAGWDEKTSQAVAADPTTSAEVLGYFISRENLRTALLPALAENSAVTEESLDEIATSGARPVIEILLKSARVMNSPRLLQALRSNATLRPNEVADIDKRLIAADGPSAEEAPDAEAPDEIVEAAMTKYLEENAAELAAEKEGKLFQAIEISHNESTVEVAHPVASSAETAKTVEESAVTVAGKTAAAAVPAKAHAVPAKPGRDSALQKIAKLNITGRIALAMRGNKEERSILIRDSTKLVSLAVLDSPKVSDAEVEKFALQKNVLEAVLRAIPMKRKFAKNYSIMRNLVFNPRTPLDLSLGLMKNLLVHDLKNLSGNKEVSETVRKLALRMFKQKIEKKG